MNVSVLGLRFKLLLFKCEIKPVPIDFLTHYPKNNRHTQTVINNWIFSLFSVQSFWPSKASIDWIVSNFIRWSDLLSGCLAVVAFHRVIWYNNTSFRDKTIDVERSFMVYLGFNIGCYLLQTRSLLKSHAVLSHYGVNG